MNSLGQMVMDLPKWPFLNEPIWRWFVFIVAISLFINVWKGVQDHMLSCRLSHAITCRTRKPKGLRHGSIRPVILRLDRCPCSS